MYDTKCIIYTQCNCRICFSFRPQVKISTSTSAKKDPQRFPFHFSLVEMDEVTQDSGSRDRMPPSGNSGS